MLIIVCVIGAMGGILTGFLIKNILEDRQYKDDLKRLQEFEKFVEASRHKVKLL